MRGLMRVITVGIGWVLLASATSGFSGYIKLAYCSSAKGLQYQLGPVFFFRISLLRKLIIWEEFAM